MQIKENDICQLFFKLFCVVYTSEMRWCLLLLGLVALTVSTSSNVELHQDANVHQSEDPLLNTTLFAEAPLEENHQLPEEIESTTNDDDLQFDDDDEYTDDESEFLPDPEALTDEEGTEDEDEEEEVVVLDDETRVVAEQLIQELDHISNKLQDDEETVGTSRAISSAEVKKLERLLETAGLSPNSPLLQNLMQQRQDAIPASVLGPSMAGMAGLSSLLGGTTPIGSGSSVEVSRSSPIAPGSMTKKNVEEIKYELKHMLFGPENPVKSLTFYPIFFFSLFIIIITVLTMVEFSPCHLIIIIPIVIFHRCLRLIYFYILPKTK